jgi:hypothetical protein
MPTPPDEWGPRSGPQPAQLLAATLAAACVVALSAMMAGPVRTPFLLVSALALLAASWFIGWEKLPERARARPPAARIASWRAEPPNPARPAHPGPPPGPPAAPAPGLAPGVASGPGAGWGAPGPMPEAADAETVLLAGNAIDSLATLLREVNEVTGALAQTAKHVAALARRAKAQAQSAWTQPQAGEENGADMLALLSAGLVEDAENALALVERLTAATDDARPRLQHLLARLPPAAAEHDAA